MSLTSARPNHASRAAGLAVGQTARPGANSPRQAQPEESSNWLCLHLADQPFALPVAQVVEIVRTTSFSYLAAAPFPVCGIVKLQNRTLPVVDLRLRLGFEAIDPAQSLIVVVASRGRRIGLLVDSVEHVSALAANSIERLPRDARTDQSYYIRGLSQEETGVVILLDLDRLLRVREES